MHIVCFTKKCLASGLNLLYYTVYYILPYTIYYIFLLACRLGISIPAAARNHNIPEATLRHKISGYHPVSKKMGPPMLLTDAEEKVLVNYILLSCDRARPVTKHNVLNAVATILSDERERGYKRLQPAACKETPGEKWWRNFRHRHPNIVFRTPESLTTSRKNVSKPSVYQWF